MTFSDLFKVMMIFQRQITWTWYNIQLYLQWPTNRKSYTVYRTAPFSMTLNDPYLEFQRHAILWRWISQKRYDTDIVSLKIGTYTRPIRNSVTSNDLEWLQNIQWHEASRGLSATAELLVNFGGFSKITATVFSKMLEVKVTLEVGLHEKSRKSETYQNIAIV